jgi:hypothetical protein
MAAPTPQTPVLTLEGKVHRDVQVTIEDLARRLKAQETQIANLTTKGGAASSVAVIGSGGSSGGGGSSVASASQVTTGLPVPPGDARQYLDGAALPAYKRVQDSDLLLSDITVNDVSEAKHGFAPKAPGDPSVYLDGTGAYSAADAFDEVFLLMGG